MFLQTYGLAITGNLTTEALFKYNGDITYPVLTAIKGNIYDLSDAEKLYGPGKAYLMTSKQYLKILKKKKL